MNDITRKRAERIISSKVADGSLIRYGDGQIIERGRLAQDTANLADKGAGLREAAFGRPACRRSSRESASAPKLSTTN